jgi:hypothetical protein
LGRVLGKHRLVPHPERKQLELALGCKVTRLGHDVMQFEYVVVGPVGYVKFPGPAIPERTEGLWNATCFEAFLASSDGTYVEFNFAPTGAWASYRFADYRNGMVPALDVPTPRIYFDSSVQRLALTAIIELPRDMAAAKKLALSAVIEETDGTKSYWALAHPPGKPDFHHPTCFAATLPPPSST